MHRVADDVEYDSARDAAEAQQLEDEHRLSESLEPYIEYETLRNHEDSSR